MSAEPQAIAAPKPETAQKSEPSDKKLETAQKSEPSDKKSDTAQKSESSDKKLEASDKQTSALNPLCQQLIRTLIKHGGDEDTCRVLGEALSELCRYEAKQSKLAEFRTWMAQAVAEARDRLSKPLTAANTTRSEINIISSDFVSMFTAIKVVKQKLDELGL
jgi:hypothetical protein